MAKKRLLISLKRQPAMVVNRIAIGDLKLVYVICASKGIRYPNGRTPIAYIGTTRNGIDRVAQSAAYEVPFRPFNSPLAPKNRQKLIRL